MGHMPRRAFVEAHGTENPARSLFVKGVSSVRGRHAAMSAAEPALLQPLRLTPICPDQLRSIAERANRARKAPVPCRPRSGKRSQSSALKPRKTGRCPPYIHVRETRQWNPWRFCPVNCELATRRWPSQRSDPIQAGLPTTTPWPRHVRTP